MAGFEVTLYGRFWVTPEAVSAGVNFVNALIYLRGGPTLRLTTTRECDQIGVTAQ